VTLVLANLAVGGVLALGAARGAGSGAAVAAVAAALAIVAVRRRSSSRASRAALDHSSSIARR
jgi:hypothetical protein